MNIATDILEGPLVELWHTIIALLPNVIGALIVFVIGVVIALALQHVVIKVIGLLHVDDLAKKLEIKTQFERAGIRLHICLVGL